MPGTVTIACKAPHGFILRNHEMEDWDEPMMGGAGSRRTKRARVVGEPVVIKGVAHPSDKAPTVQMIGGYALTHNVDADFWSKWVKDNAEHDAVKNGVIFAHEKAGHVEGLARERVKTRSGAEALDPARLPGKIQTAERAA